MSFTLTDAKDFYAELLVISDADQFTLPLHACVCIDMYTDICTRGTCTGTCIDMGMDMCVGMCIDMCVDMRPCGFVVCDAELF